MYGLSFERYRTLALLMVVAGGVTAAIDFIYAIITVLRHAGDVTDLPDLLRRKRGAAGDLDCCWV